MTNDYAIKKLKKYQDIFRVIKQLSSQDDLRKAADADYKNKADNSAALLIPVTLEGQHQMSNGLPYHLTVKSFGDKEEVEQEEIDSKLAPFEEDLKKGIDAEKLIFVPYQLKTPSGVTHNVLLVRNLPKFLEDIYSSTKDMGTYMGKYLPHISLDDKAWEKFSQMGTELTAKDVGIKFHPAELRSGPNTIKTY